MHIPLNVIHYYIGAPILGGVAIETYLRNQRRPNVTHLYLFCSFLYFTIALLSLGLPALFTSDPFKLSAGSFIGDCCLAVGLLFFWFICINAFLATRPRLKQIVSICVVILTAAILFEAVPRDLGFPYNTHLVSTAHNGLAITYSDTITFKIMNGVDSLAFVWIGILLWQQSKSAPTKAQKLRIQSLAIAALFGAASFIVAPALPVEKQLLVTAILMSIGFSTILVASIVGLVCDKRSNSQLPA